MSAKLCAAECALDVNNTRVLSLEVIIRISAPQATNIISAVDCTVVLQAVTAAADRVPAELLRAAAPCAQHPSSPYRIAPLSLLEHYSVRWGKLCAQLPRILRHEATSANPKTSVLPVVNAVLLTTLSPLHPDYDYL